MHKLRAGLALAASVILIVSSGVHSFAGWPSLRAQLTASHTPADLAIGLELVWHFAGVAMLALGTIAFATSLRIFKGEQASRLPLIVIAVSYIAIGGWALVWTKFDPFTLIFLVPGMLLVPCAVSKASGN